MNNIEKTDIALEKIPNPEKIPKGSQIFLLDDEKRISVFDNYSRFPNSNAKKWKVRIFNRETGFEYDRACTFNGIFPTHDMALSEIERFRGRADKLIFYVAPHPTNSFTYNKKSFIFGASEELSTEFIPANLQEQQEEAKKRIFVITGRNVAKDINLMKKYKGYYGEEVLSAFNKRYEEFMELDDNRLTEGQRPLPYMIIGGICKTALLYVSENKSQWYDERSGIGDKTGYTNAFVCMRGKPLEGEFGDVFYKYYKGTVYLTA